MGLFQRLSKIFKSEVPQTNNDHLHENQQYSKKIVLENGESVNVRGNENQLNLVKTSRYTLTNCLYVLIIKFFKRFLNLYLFVINMIQLDYNYLISLLLTFTIHTIIELYFDTQKRKRDEIINSHQTTVFADLKKNVLNMPSQNLIQLGGRKSLNKNIVEHEKIVNNNNYQKDICARKVSIDTVTYRQDKQPRIPLFTIKRWDQLKVGDIIYLKNNEICPADVLILDMGQSVSMASNTIMSGNTNEVRKRACPLTTITKEHKIQLLDYRTILNGIIRYDQNDSDQYYKGMVKLKKDPKPLEINKENIFFREQLLLNDLYLFGVILSVGLDCRCYKSFKHVEKQSYFEQKANLYFGIAILSLILLSVIQYIIEYYGEHHYNLEFQLINYSNLLPLYFYFLIDVLYFTQMLYNNYLFQKEKVNQNHSIKDVNPLLDNAHIKLHHLQVNYSPISNLSLINHVLIDKTGTLTMPNFKIKWIFIFDSLYKLRYRAFAEKDFLNAIKQTKRREELNIPIDERIEPESTPMIKCNNEEVNFKIEDLDDDHPAYDELHRTQPPRFRPESQISSQFDQSAEGIQIQKQSQPRGSSLIVNSLHESKRQLTNQRGSQKFHAPRISSNLDIVSEVEFSGNELTLIRRIEDNEFKPHYFEAMFALVVCQNTRSLYQKSDDSFFYEYSSDLDKQQLYLCKHYGFKFICRSKQENHMKFVIQDGEEIYSIDVMSLHSFNSRKFSIIIKLQEELCNKLGLENDDQQYLQYLRDDSLDMIGCLSLEKDQMAKLDLMIKDLQVQGSRPVLFYRSLMTETQMSAFIKEANKLLDIQSNKIEFMHEYQFLMHEFEKNCDLVSVIGVQEKINKNVVPTLNGIKQLGIPCWITSGDNYEKVLPIAYRVQLLNSNETVIHIQAKTQDELFLQLKQLLQSLSGQLRSHSKKKEIKHSDTLIHKKGSFTCSPRWISSGQKNLHIKQFQIVINGESLEQIYRDAYLKKHFQFLFQFTSNFIGYRMTPQQKSILVKLLKDTKLNYKFILSIGDSFSDINLFNHSDFVFQMQSGRQIFPHDKNNFEDLQHGRVSIKQLDQESQFCQHKQDHGCIEPLYNSDIYIKDFELIHRMIALDSRKSALYFERILIFSLFRSFGIIYLLCVTQLIRDEHEVITKDYLKFHSNIFFLLSSSFIISEISEKVENFNHSEFMYFLFKNDQLELNNNKFGKQIARITLVPLIQALLINLYTEYADLSTNNGIVIKSNELGSGLFLLLLIVDALKLVQRNYITQKQFVFNIGLTFGLYTLISLQFDSISIIYQWAASIQNLFSFIFIMVIHVIFNLILYHINRPFFMPLAIQTTNEYDEIVKIYNKISGDISKQIQLHRATIEKISYFARKLFNGDEDMDPIIKQMLNGAFADESENSINSITLRFKSQLVQNKFTDDILQYVARTYRIIVALTFLFYEIATYTIILLTVDNFSLSYWTDYYYISMFGVLLLLMLFCWSRYYKVYFYQVNFIILFIRCSSIIIWLFNQDQSVGGMNLNMLQLSLAVNIYHYQEQPLISQVFSAIYVAIYLIKKSNENDIYILINQYVMSLASLFHLVLTFRRIIYIFLEVFLGRINMNKENQIMSDILSILLPQFIRDRINKAGQYDIQEDQGMVAVLFCDIIDFDQLIKNEQSNVVDILDKLFRRFDLLCQQHEVQKIETVGKTYMAAAGLKIHVSQKSNPVNKVISLALDMKKYVMSNETFQIKIGIHYGNVIAGVIGHHKPQFSLIGDTINTASRICSTAEPWNIAISEQAYRQTNKFELVYIQRDVEAKGKGKLITYVVNTKRGGKQRKQTIMIQKPPKQPFRDPKEYQNLDQIHENQLSELGMGSNREVQPLVNRNEDHQPLTLNKRQRNEIYNYVTKTQKQIMIESPSKSLQQQMLFQQSQAQIFLNQGGGSSKNYASQSIVGGIQSQGYDDRNQKHQYLIQLLERKTRCELNVSDYQLNMEYHVEKDKIKALYSVDEDSQGQNLLLTLNPKRLYLEFNEDNTVTLEFYEFLSSLYRPFAVQNLLTIGSCVLISSVSCITLNGQIYLVNLISGIIIGLLHILLCTLIHKYESFYNVIYFLILAYLLLGSYALDCFLITDHYEIQIAKGIIYCLSVLLNRILRHYNKLVYLVLFLGVTIAAIIVNDWPWSRFYYTAIISIFAFCIQLFMFLKNVNSYNVNKQLIEKSMKYQFLLNYLLPKNVLEEFFRPNEEKRVLREQADEVTLLFADIAGFTEYSSKVQPEQVVNMLRNLFTEFDKNCLLHNVFKLYTIGDCYVVMGMIDYGKGIQRNTSQEAVNVVRMGFAMIDAIRRVRAHINHPTLDMRIGVHTGSIIGGVLGTELVRYDIYGPDVLIANKMESKGAKGFVQVSQETKDIIEREFPDLFRFEYKQSIEFESIERKTSGYFVYQ
ncbi:unnamed protein product [Paramecium pentaurelia]|uniref:Guanylate cyclase domain-containing protein n=1 Tax=Paramecium pentaurelia TaxID=43138 RepID=A0A8S1VA86_9CILI|nr:unnamed protein product [Paramecium pentaurelia]